MPIEIEDMQTEVHVGREAPLGTSAQAARPGSAGALAGGAALEGLVLGILEEALERMIREVD